PAEQASARRLASTPPANASRWSIEIVDLGGISPLCTRTATLLHASGCSRRLAGNASLATSNPPAGVFPPWQLTQYVVRNFPASARVNWGAGVCAAADAARRIMP